MSQYGDPQPNSRPPFRRHTPSSNGFKAQPTDRSPADLRLPPRPTNPGGSPPANGSWNTRRRNEWREHQQMTSAGTAFTASGPGADNGVGRGDRAPERPPRPGKKPLDLPSPPPTPARPQPSPEQSSGVRPRNRRPLAPRPMPGPGEPPRALGPIPLRGQAPPKAAAPEGADRNPAERLGSDRNSKVTPLRRRPLPPLPPTLREQGDGPQGLTADPRQARPARRKLRKAPLPVLYAIRLLIIGVGVAAIAGTLLSALSPSEVGSAPTTTSQESTAAGTPVRGLRGRQSASIDQVSLTDEIPRLKTELEQLATLTPGLTPTAFAVDLETGKYVDLNGAQPVAAASTIKMPILVAFLQAVDAGTVNLDQALVLQPQEIVGGSGNLQAKPPGTQFSALEVATQMIIHSDNTATNMIINLLGGTEALNQQFQAWGLTSTVLRNPLPDLPGTNTSSPRDLALLMALVDRGDVLSLRSRDRLFSIMQRTVNRSLIPSGLQEGSLVANKTGDIAAVLGDIALVDTPLGRRYVLAVMVQRPENDGRAGELIRRVAEQVNQELDQPLAPMGATQPTRSTEVPDPPEGYFGGTREGYPTQPQPGDRSGTAPQRRTPINSYPREGSSMDAPLDPAPLDPGMEGSDSMGSEGAFPSDSTPQRGDSVPQG